MSLFFADAWIGSTRNRANGAGSWRLAKLGISWRLGKWDPHLSPDFQRIQHLRWRRSSFYGKSSCLFLTHLLIISLFSELFQNDTTNLIWALGASDEISYHGPGNRGTFTLNLLDTELPLNTDQLMRFDVMINNTMPSQDTTYWCKIVQSPAFAGKHHFVAVSKKQN